jgi:anaerobic selenocysteine-containing dehydrogenase
MHRIPTFCRVCEPACGLLAEVDGDRLVGLRPDPEHPVSRGFACHKGIASLEIHRDRDRVDHPLRRRGDGSFESVSWDAALREIASRLRDLIDREGAASLSAYLGNPNAFNTFVGPAIASFLGQLGVRRHFSSGTQDCANKFAAGEAVFGTSTLHPVPDIGHTDHLLLLGENPRVSHMSFLSLPDPVAELRSAVRRGAVVRHVNPRRIEEPEAGTGEVVRILPDTDVYLLAAMLDTIFEEGREDAEALAEHGTRVVELRRFVARYPADRVAGLVGLPSGRIRELARDFASAPRAAVHMSTGANMGRQGTLVYWLVQMLSLSTGNLDREGGNLYSEGFYPGAARSGRTRPESQFFDGRHGRMRRIRGSWPGNLMADEILEGDPPIRALFVVAGNPVLSVAGEDRMREALERLDLLVCLDLYRNATAELAHFVLPCTDGFERADVNIAGLGLQSRPYVQYSEAVVPPRGECREEWWILARLEQELGLSSVLDAGPEPDLTGRLDHMLATRGIDLEELRSEPRGRLLEPLTPGRLFGHWIQTEDRRVDCCPPVFEKEGALLRCETICRELEAERGVLKLISLRTPSMHNSWYHNVEVLKRPHSRDNPLHMHPEDAAERGLAHGAAVRCHNRWGSLTTTVACDDTLRRGVVAMTHGWGNQRTPGMSLAQRHPGVNCNRLLPSGPDSWEPLSNQAFMTGIPVEVEPL